MAIVSFTCAKAEEGSMPKSLVFPLIALYPYPDFCSLDRNCQQLDLGWDYLGIVSKVSML